MSCLEEARAAVEGAKQRRADLVQGWWKAIARIARRSPTSVRAAGQGRCIQAHQVTSNPIRKISR